MSNQNKNAHGLYDAPVRSTEKESVTLSPEDIEAQLDAGAFFLPYEDAVELGFLHPHDAQDVVIAKVVGKNHE